MRPQTLRERNRMRSRAFEVEIKPINHRVPERPQRRRDLHSERPPDEIRGGLRRADGAEAAFGVGGPAYAEENSLAVDLLAGLDVLAVAGTADQLGAIEEGAVVLLVSEVDDGLAAEAGGELVEEGHGDYVDVGVWVVLSELFVV